jgi:hypothetical protein
MTGYLKFLVLIESLAYFLYLLFFLFPRGSFNFSGIENLTYFVLVTFGFVTSIVILLSIIDVREAVFNQGVLSDGHQRLFQTKIPSGQWTCTCGFSNPQSQKMCLSCGKNKS